MYRPEHLNQLPPEAEAEKSEEEQFLRFPEGIGDNNESRRLLYRWHHKQELPEEAELNLAYQEVLPGYSTFVEVDKHHEYEAITPFTIYHHTYNVEEIPSVVQQGALLSADERRRRGIESKGGLSPDIDRQTGTSDFVFTRIITPDGLKTQKERDLYGGEFTFIFENDITDRLDWYAFNDDRYGGADPSTFSGRVTPLELFERQKQRLDLTNEQMFKTGISLGKVKSLACGSEKSAMRLIEALSEAGIKEINGKPLEEIIFITPTKMDLFSASQGERAVPHERVAELINQYREQSHDSAQPNDELGL